MPPPPPPPQHLLRVLLIVILCVHGFLHAGAGAGGSGGGSKSPRGLLLELRRHPGPAAPLDRARELHRGDQLRQQVIRERIGRRRACDVSGNGSAPTAAPMPAPAVGESFEMPLNSGAFTGTGQYFARFLLGTPAQPFLLVVDTGSDLTWVKCRLGGDAACRSGGCGGRAFRPGESSTFETIPCSSGMCKTSLPFSLTACPTPTTPCAYDYGYADGSGAQGVFANESATVILPGRRRAKLRGLVVGCTTSSAGSSFRASDGVLGLGYSDISFAARATARFGGRFSYCLVDHLSPRNATSFLTFGPAREVLAAARRLRETPLVIDPRIGPFYAVGIKGISVDGEMLAIPAGVWDIAADGGTIIDSGTSLTMLVDPAYKIVAEALSRRLDGVPRVSVEPFEYCYNWTAEAATAAAAAAALPKMVVHLDGGARLSPPAKSYVIDVAEGVKCLGISSAPWPGVSTIGNILQQEHLWEFDVRNRRLRFRRSTCRAR